MTSLLDRITRHQVYLEGFKAGAILAFNPYLEAVEKSIRGELAMIKLDGLDELTKAKLRTLIATLRGVIAKQFNRYVAGMLKMLMRFMRADITMMTAIMEDAERPNSARLWLTILKTALPGNGQFLENMLDALSMTATAKVVDTIHKAAANGVKVSEAVAALVGSPSTLFGGSVLQKIARQNAILVDTIVQHISQITETTIAKGMFDVYTWFSIIDKGTTQICVDRNGNVYTYGEGPLPPAHYGCRSTTVPGDPEFIPATFKIWFDDQPDAVRKDMGNITIPRPLSLDGFNAKLSLILQ